MVLGCGVAIPGGTWQLLREPHPAAPGLRGSHGEHLPSSRGNLPSAAIVVGRAELKQGGKRTWVTIHLESPINIFQLHPFWVPFPAALVQASTKSPRQ